MKFALLFRMFLFGVAAFGLMSCVSSAGEPGGNTGKHAEPSENTIARHAEAPANKTIASTDVTSAKIIRCKDSRGDDRQLCDSVMSDFDKKDHETFEAFEITVSRVDLNNNGAAEVIVWESSWAGTSGGGLWILSPNSARYTILFEGDGAWTPILVLPVEHHGWRDIAYLEAGGGVEPAFITVTHNGKRYVDRARVDPSQPGGEVVIEKKWKHTTFGPTNR